MNDTSITVEAIQEPDIAYAGTLMEEMWRAHAQQSPLIDEARIMSISGESYIRDLLKSDITKVFVARYQTEIIGVGTCTIRNLPPFYVTDREAYIDDLSVAPNYRRRGVASMIVAACQDFARQRSVTVVTAKVWSFNRESAAMFDHIGFTNDYSAYGKFVPPAASKSKSG